MWSPSEQVVISLCEAVCDDVTRDARKWGEWRRFVGESRRRASDAAVHSWKEAARSFATVSQVLEWRKRGGIQTRAEINWKKTQIYFVIL